jgi:O-6-methylguanine DNA methyltransferase
MMKYAIFDTAWGSFGFVANGKHLVATFLPQRRQSIRRQIMARWPGATEEPKLLPQFRKQVVAYFCGRPARFNVDLDLTGVPPFGQAVLRACHRIPHGKTATYADLAKAVGKPGAARAVGGTMARNPLPLVVPCHRVLRSDGSLGGFSGPTGVKEKARLLRLEKAIPC